MSKDKKEPAFYNLLRTALPEGINFEDLPDTTVASVNVHIGLFRPYIDLDSSSKNFHYAANEHVKFTAVIDENTDIEAIESIQKNLKDFISLWQPLSLDPLEQLKPLGEKINEKD